MSVSVAILLYKLDSTGDGAIRILRGVGKEMIRRDKFPLMSSLSERRK